MPRTRISLTGAVLASAASGPLFMLGILLGILSTAPATAIPVTLDISTGDIPAIVIGVPTAFVTIMLVGTVIALLPTMIGTAMMTRLGDLNPAFRLPVMWALAGASACALFVALNVSESPTPLVALTFTGACCALICRYGGRILTHRVDRLRHTRRQMRATRVPVRAELFEALFFSSSDGKRPF